LKAEGPTLWEAGLPVRDDVANGSEREAPMKRAIGLIGLIVLVAGITALSVAQPAPESVQAVSGKWARSGHSDAQSESFTHWNEDEPPVIPAGCAKCHSSYGFLDYLGEDGTSSLVVDSAAATGSVISCNACHNDSAHAMTEVEFPSGATVVSSAAEANCMQCHQGRSSSNSVARAIEGLADDEVNENLAFINAHYLIAASTQLGAEAGGAYQYHGSSYAGRFTHHAEVSTCVQCHDVHSLDVSGGLCSICHVNVVDDSDFEDIRVHTADYDGDDFAEEGIAKEIGGMQIMLGEAIQAYADSIIGKPLVYVSDAYPYFFVDSDADGRADSDEASFGNRYQSWTPRLVRCAYNYHFVFQDPGCYVHNPDYIVQILHDTLKDLAEVVALDLQGLARPGDNLP